MSSTRPSHLPPFRNPAAPSAAAAPAEALAWLIIWSDVNATTGETVERRTVHRHNAVADYRTVDPAARVVPLYAALPAAGTGSSAGVRAIADERQRQVEAEGFSVESDSDYRAGELVKAALAYVQIAAMDLSQRGRDHIATGTPPACWPWDRLWWKPKDARRDLVRAGALIAAQLDALNAAAGVDRG